VRVAELHPPLPNRFGREREEGGVSRQPPQQQDPSAEPLVEPLEEPLEEPLGDPLRPELLGAKHVPGVCWC
jgi:hypothetical protein